MTEMKSVYSVVRTDSLYKASRLSFVFRRKFYFLTCLCTFEYIACFRSAFIDISNIIFCNYEHNNYWKYTSSCFEEAQVARRISAVSVSIVHLEFDFLGWTLLGFYFILLAVVVGHAVAQLVEALRYKPEGRGFDSRWCHWNFLFT